MRASFQPRINRCWRSRTLGCSARSRRRAASSRWRASINRNSILQDLLTSADFEVIEAVDGEAGVAAAVMEGRVILASRLEYLRLRA